MYYPIIDKLKEVMSDLTSVKAKEPLIIEGTITSQTGGTWTGTLFSDIISSLSNNRPVFFKIIVPNDTILIPIFECNANIASSVCFPYNVGGTVTTTYGIVFPNNNFQLSFIA